MGARDKKPVSYSKMIQGIGEVSNSMDYEGVGGVNNPK